MTGSWRHKLADDRGAMDDMVSAVLIIPSLFLLVSLGIAGSRIALAHQGVDQASAQAARSGSLARNPQVARQAALDTTYTALNGQQLNCTSVHVDVDTSRFLAPAGVAGSVTADVTCQLNLSDVALPGLPGQITIHSRQSSPTDPYREQK